MDRKNDLPKRLHIQMHRRPEMADKLDIIAKRQKPKSITRNELVLHSVMTLCRKGSI